MIDAEATLAWPMTTGTTAATFFWPITSDTLVASPGNKAADMLIDAYLEQRPSPKPEETYEPFEEVVSYREPARRVVTPKPSWVERIRSKIRR